VVIGGEIAKLGEVFLEKIQSYLKQIELKPNVNKVEVRYSCIKGNLVTLGGARVVLDRIFLTGGFWGTFDDAGSI